MVLAFESFMLFIVRLNNGLSVVPLNIGKIIHLFSSAQLLVIVPEKKLYFLTVVRVVIVDKKYVNIQIYEYYNRIPPITYICIFQRISM